MIVLLRENIGEIFVTWDRQRFLRYNPKKNDPQTGKLDFIKKNSFL